MEHNNLVLSPVCLMQYKILELAANVSDDFSAMLRRTSLYVKFLASCQDIDTDSMPLGLTDHPYVEKNQTYMNQTKGRLYGKGGQNKDVAVRNLDADNRLTWWQLANQDTNMLTTFEHYNLWVYDINSDKKKSLFQSLITQKNHMKNITADDFIALKHESGVAIANLLNLDNSDISNFNVAEEPKNMTEQVEYIKLDRYFMNHVSCCCDSYQKEDIYQIDALKDDFQKVLDVVKPIKTERACTDAEKEKYHLSYHKDIQNALEYEQCYTLLLDLVSDCTTCDKVDFLYPYVPYLRGILNIASAVDDNWIFKRYCHNQIIAYLLVYRYENKISILDDLHMELSRKDVDLFWVDLSQKLSDQRFQKILELQRNHPEEYRKMKDEKKKFFLQNMDNIKKLAEMRGISINSLDEK